MQTHRLRVRARASVSEELMVDPSSENTHQEVNNDGYNNQDQTQ